MSREIASIFSSRSGKIGFAIRWLFLFALLYLAGLMVCAFVARNTEKYILGEVREAQMHTLRQAVDFTAAWRDKIIEDVHGLSQSAHLKAIPRSALSGNGTEKLLNPDHLRALGPDARETAATLGMARTYLQGITRGQPWLYASLLGAQGNDIISSGVLPPLTKEKEELLRRAAANRRVELGQPVQAGATLAIPVCAPIYDHAGAAQKPAAYLLLAAEAENLAQKTAGTESSNAIPVTIMAIFSSGSNTAMIGEANGKAAIVPLKNSIDAAQAGFGLKMALGNDGRVYSAGMGMKNPPLLFVAETGEEPINHMLKAAWIKIYGSGLLFCLVLSFLLAWLQLILDTRKFRHNAMRERELADTMERQEALLESINSSLGIGLLILDGDGKVEMGNEAFLDICGCQGKLARGMSLENFLPLSLACAITRDMRIVNDARHYGSMETTIPGCDENTPAKVCRISLYPVSKKGSGSGGIAIFQDITSFRQESKISRERQLALISALGRAIESIDPNLVGHSEKLENVSALLAQSLRLEENERETLSLASRLSQVGKLFVPRELLLKRGRLSPVELAEVRRAPEYADKILSTLHFDLPVRETAAMIGEKLDGSGKPNGLMGEELTIPGRILAVANAFIAMTSPRAWRGGRGLEIDEAIQHLRAESGFDQHIVNTLASIPRMELEKAVGIAG